MRFSCSFLGNGVYSSVLQMTFERYGREWSMAVSASIVDKSLYSADADMDDEPQGNEGKMFGDIIPELSAGYLATSLRQPGFLPYYRSFVVEADEVSSRMFTSGGAAAADTPLAALCYGLSSATNKRRDVFASVKSADSHVLFTCMGLGDGGDFTRMMMTNPARVSAPLARSWVFKLLWSLLIAQRTFGLEMRDIKVANLVMTRERSIDTYFDLRIDSAILRQELKCERLPPSEISVVFKAPRLTDDLADLAPKFIDFNFASYAFTTLPASIGSVQAARNYMDTYEQHIGSAVNESAKFLSTYPSPDLIFCYGTGDRNFDSDVFSFGILVFEMLASDEGVFFRTCTPPTSLWTHRSLFKKELSKLGCTDSVEESVMLAFDTYHRVIGMYMVFLNVLGHGQLPNEFSSVLADTPFCRVLKSTAFRPILSDIATATGNLTQPMAYIRRKHGDVALDFIRSCVTWDKETRGVFPGGPRARAETPATLRLLLHPFFSPLQVAAITPIEQTNGYHVLHYNDPPSIPRMSNNAAKTTRVFDRIRAIESRVVGEIADVLNVESFDARFTSFARAIFDALPKDPLALARTSQKRVQEEVTDANATQDSVPRVTKKSKILYLIADEESL